MLPQHLFIGSDGVLIDTRDPMGFAKPIRKEYHCHVRDIDSVAQLKACLRAGKYTFPGGYPLGFITSDGELLAFATVRDNLRNVIESIKDRIDTGWRVVACDVNWEHSHWDCEGNLVEAAYDDID